MRFLADMGVSLRVVEWPDASAHCAPGLTMPRLIDARHVRDFVLWLRFSDGIQGEVDLAGELNGPVFEPLKDPVYFRSFTLSPELHTIVWPNGADLAPEFLHEHVRIHA